MTNLQRYQHYTRKFESPDLYIEFSFYSLIASCLERRVWLGTIDREVFPNLYIVFVGEPGTGKSICARVNYNLLNSLQEKNPLYVPGSNNGQTETRNVITIAPSTTTVEALIYKLSMSMEVFKVGTQIYGHSSITIISEELGNLFKRNEDNLITFLCEGFDCGDYKKETKTQGNDHIRKMCINILAATNPEWMTKAGMNSSIGEGLTSRIIFIAGGNQRHRTAFLDLDSSEMECYDYLRKYLDALSKINGKCVFTPEATKFVEDWYINSQPVNPAKNLKYYQSRKRIHLMKLAVVMNFSDHIDCLDVSLNCVEKALDALNRAEINMHEALAGSGSNSSHTLSIAIMRYLKDKKQPITQRNLWMYFSDTGDMAAINQALEFLTVTGQVMKILVTPSNEIGFKII